MLLLQASMSEISEDFTSPLKKQNFNSLLLGIGFFFFFPKEKMDP